LELASQGEDTLIVIAHYRTVSERPLSRAAAVLFILGELGGVWRYAQILQIVPTSLLDLLYRLVAKNRYRFFGRYDSCLLPDREHRSRFIEV
jgi:predicted DCC family thiol-disulfide oxidoreductase YuxK